MHNNLRHDAYVLKENYKHQEATISKDAYWKEEEFDSSVKSVYFENIMIGPIWYNFKITRGIQIYKKKYKTKVRNFLVELRNKGDKPSVRLTRSPQIALNGWTVNVFGGVSLWSGIRS